MLCWTTCRLTKPAVAKLAGSSQKEAVASPLHPHLFLLAQPGRGVVQTAHRPAAPPRNLHQCRCSHRGHRSVGRALERRPKPFVWRKTADDIITKVRPRPNRPHPPNQIRDAPLGVNWPRLPPGGPRPSATLHPPQADLRVGSDGHTSDRPRRQRDTAAGVRPGHTHRSVADEVQASWRRSGRGGC